MRRALNDTNSDVFNLAGADTGSVIDVGLIDSLYSPAEWLADEIVVHRSVDEIDQPDIGDTTGHGTSIAYLLESGTLNEIRFSLYRVTQTNREGHPFIWDSNMEAAIRKASDLHGVDVMNISLGNDHMASEDFDCTEHHQPCKLSRVAQDAIDRGVPIVSGTGNEVLCDSLCCPAAVDEVIGVGAAIVRCGKRISPDDPFGIGGKYTKPPMAVWVERDDGTGTDEVFCGGEGCMPGASCEENRVVESWEGNVPPTHNKPDILAPAVHVAQDGDLPVITVGTSYSTPVVTNCVIETLSGLKEYGETPTPQQIRRGLRESAQETEETDERLLSCADAIDSVGNELGYEFELDGDDEPPMLT